MKIKENSTVYKIGKILLKIAVALVTVYLVWRAFGTMLPGLLPLLRHGDQKEIAAYLEQAGQWRGMLCTFMLAILQVISVIIPGAAIQIAAGAIYGWWKGFIMCFTGYWIANVGVFYFARKVRNHKLENHSMNPMTVKLMELMNSANPGFVVAVSCLMPGIPNGIIPYIAARSAPLYRRQICRDGEGIRQGSGHRLLDAHPVHLHRGKISPPGRVPDLRGPDHLPAVPDRPDRVEETLDP